MITYRCDNCDIPMGPSEAIGSGVYPPGDTAFHYEDPDMDLCIHITLSKHNSSEQFCKACMWIILDRMMEKMGPSKYAKSNPTTDQD